MKKIKLAKISLEGIEETEPFIDAINTKEIKSSSYFNIFKRYSSNIMAFGFLTLQTTIVVLLMRKSRLKLNDDAPMFSVTVAVFLAELGKCLIGIIKTIYDIKYNDNNNINNNNNNICKQLYKYIFGDQKTFLSMSIPAILYSIQNVLLFKSLEHLDGAFYQILYQLKTFTAAFLAYVMIGRVYSVYQWISFVCLAVGATLANLSIVNDIDIISGSEDNKPIIGIICVITATFTSGFSGVFMEIKLKNTKQSLYVKNIQLSLFGMIGCIINAYITGDIKNIFKYGMLNGFNNLTYIIIILNIFGGYLVSYIIKYIENITKAFISTTALIFIIYGSYIFFNTKLNHLFFIGFTFVVIGNALFNHKLFCQK